MAQKSLNTICELFSKECAVIVAPQCISQDTENTVKQTAKKDGPVFYITAPRFSTLTSNVTLPCMPT